MKLNKITENCYAISVLRRLKFNLNPAESISVISYNNSRALRMPSALFLRLGKYFKYSFLASSGKSTKKKIIDFVDNVIIRGSYIGYKRLRDWFMASLASSPSLVIVKEAVEEFHIKPVKILGLMLIFSTLANILFVTLLKENIAFYGWGIRALLFFLGLAGLFCEENLPNLKDGSLFGQWIKKLKS